MLFRVRAWLGMVEQVSFIFSKTEGREPFRDLHRKDEGFAWLEELRSAFK